MFNVSQLYSITHFLGVIFLEVYYNEWAFSTINEKKKRPSILRSCFLRFHQRKLGFFSLQYDVENFIFLFKYHQLRLKHLQKIACFCCNTYSYRVGKLYSYIRICICVKMLLSYIFVWRKVQKIWYFRETKIYQKIKENMIFSVLFTNFCKTKILFFMQCRLWFYLWRC